MCRLTAYAGEPLAADVLVFGGPHSLLEQSYVPRELLYGHVNADGYGVVWYRGATPIRIGSARPIWQDEDLRALLEGVSSSTILAAVRNATPGIPIEGGNQPLLHGRWSFVLNGFVENFRPSHMRTLRSHLRTTSTDISRAPPIAKRFSCSRLPPSRPGPHAPTRCAVSGTWCSRPCGRKIIPRSSPWSWRTERESV